MMFSIPSINLYRAALADYVPKSVPNPQLKGITSGLQDGSFVVSKVKAKLLKVTLVHPSKKYYSEIKFSN